MRQLLFGVAVAVMTIQAAVKIEKINYQGWPNSYRISNGEVELVVTSDIGPRIMRYGFVNGQNLFKEFPETLGKSGEPEWVLRGGHRLWVAPEDLRYTYPPDNSPVEVRLADGVLEAIQPVERETGIQKSLLIRMAPTGSQVEIVHRLKNTTLFSIEFAPWALTMMAPGGVAVTGFPPRGKHPDILPPTNPLVMWAYTNLADPRWKFTKKYLTLRQDPANAEPQKLGSFLANTWLGYFLNGEFFLKRSTADPARRYPDFQCSWEMFTNADFLELETLGPWEAVPAGGTISHVETWTLHRNIPLPPLTDEALDKVLSPLLR